MVPGGGSASERDDASEAVGAAELAAFAGLEPDVTGLVTFVRFRWQAKLAVRAWLRVFADSGTLAVVCEYVEDLAIVEAAGFRFAQLKTRDKGSWSAAKICENGHAIERLVASYKLADSAGIVGISQFEVWLEGPPSEQKATTDFFADPTSAPDDLKKKIRQFGIAGAKLADFLKRLTIRCHQPARQSVDAVNVRLIGAIWPALSMQQVELLYEKLLQVAEAAQGASEPPPSVRAAMNAARASPAAISAWEPIARQALTEQQLRGICPPIPADTDQDLIARAASGEASVLELKLVRAGASETTVEVALLARAEADVTATSARASGLMSEAAESALDSRMLDSAKSLAALAASSGTTLTRPAEHIFHSLMSNVANTAALDVDDLYDRDHRLLVGHLCSVSDQCRFGWGV
jgi:hypothetical protein